jgi:diacylglycerol O-acyltransferase / wax synthase
VWSYVDQLAISVLTDDLTLDDPHEATGAMIDAFIEIRRAAGLSANLTPVADTLSLASMAVRTYPARPSPFSCVCVPPHR